MSRLHPTDRIILAMIPVGIAAGWCVWFYSRFLPFDVPWLKVLGTIGICWLCGSSLYFQVQTGKLRSLNQALMDGAARRLMDDIRPELAAALDRVGEQP